MALTMRALQPQSANSSNNSPMETRVISIDQSTQSTKGFVFDEKGTILSRASLAHKQIYPRSGFVEHDPEEIYRNTVNVIRELTGNCPDENVNWSIAITNQRETVVVWNKITGKPVCNAVVWQCTRGEEICNRLKEEGYSDTFKQKSGLLIDPYFSASGVKWVLDNVEGVRQAAEKGEILMGTIETWLIWKLTEGRSHVTDYTNASRTLLFNIHTMDWDRELLDIMTIPASMLAKPLPSDAVFGQTTVEGLFSRDIQIAGAIGDSHGALVGQMCFTEGLGKATYGTGSSVMVNIGEKYSNAPEGLVTSVGFAALGKVFYGFEGNIHCTGMTVSWLVNELKLISDASQIEAIATSVENNAGVYFVPAFAGLGAPWWRPKAKAVISGLSLGTGLPHVCRAALESIGFQVTDLIKAMTETAGIQLRELRVDGGPTKNNFLMQFQSDLLGVPVVRSEIEDASAFGAFIMNGFARGTWSSFDQPASLANFNQAIVPHTNENTLSAYKGWREAVEQLMK